MTTQPSSDLHITDWSAQPARNALNATQVVTHLAQHSGWTLAGDGADVAIEKTFRFADYFETIAFVNAVALVAHRLDHHPDLAVHYNRATVRWNTHDAGGLTATDFDAAARVDALLS